MNKKYPKAWADFDDSKIRELALKFRGLSNHPDIKLFKENGNYFLGMYWWPEQYNSTSLPTEDKRWHFTLNDIKMKKQ